MEKKNKYKEKKSVKIFDIKKIIKEGIDDTKDDQREDFNHERYKLLSFKKIKEIVDKLIKDAQLSEKNINEFHKIFKLSDLESTVNFKYLSFLKENEPNKFQKYINKYLYTLNYDEAKLLVDLKIEEDKELKKLNNFRSLNNIKSIIKEIDSLSKLKLVNFIYQINNFYKTKKQINDYIDLLEEYSLNTNLKYRLPNFCGSRELLFYTYLQLFIEIFSFEIDKDENTKMDIDFPEEKDNKKEENINKINNNEDSANEEECFSISDISYQDENNYEFKNDEIINDINEFFEYINNNNNIIEKGNKIDEDIILNKNFRTASIYMQYLNSFDIFIEKKMIIDFDKDDFLEQIDFIYFTITYFRYNNKDNKLTHFNKQPIEYILYEPQEKRKEALIFINCDIKDKKYFKNLSQDKKESLIYTNLSKCNIPIESAINNPFNNCSEYYKFPFNMTKNPILFDNEFYKEFKDFILEVYESKLFKEIFYVTDDFKDFFYPFEGEEKDNIFSEMFELTKFYPFEFDYLHGYTNKILPKILISSIFKNAHCLEKMIINFVHIINTLFHEQLKHYIKGLIHYNSLRLNLSVSLESKKPLNEEVYEKYKKVVKKKKKY